MFSDPTTTTSTNHTMPFLFFCIESKRVNRRTNERTWNTIQSECFLCVLLLLLLQLSSICFCAFHIHSIISLESLSPSLNNNNSKILTELLLVIPYLFCSRPFGAYLEGTDTQIESQSKSLIYILLFVLPSTRKI